MRSVFIAVVGVVLTMSLANPILADDKHEKHEQHHEAPAGVDPQIAFGWMKNGNNRFVLGNFRKDGRGKAERKANVGGQKPHTIVLSCADSRVPPEHVFDQGIGEIFVVRAAGEALDSSVIASLEYAVAHLGARQVIVMGHTSCGAVKAAYSTKEGASAGSPDLDKLVADIKPRLGDVKTPSKDFEAESHANAKGVAADLVKRSKIIQLAAESGQIKIRPALYHLDSGRVEF